MALLFGVNPFGSALFWLLLVAAAGAVGAWTRRIWAGGAVAFLLALVGIHPLGLFRWPLIFMAITLLGVVAGLCGWALRQRRHRLVALGGLWTGAGLALFYLYLLTTRPHGTADLVFAGGLLLTVLMLGSLTVIALPPDGPSS